jgi:DNA-binding transcriptional MerR regulator
MDDNRADNHAKAVPLWVRQWHSREELAARFQVSVRTLHRHVNRGNIERRENLDGTSDYRPILNAWTLDRVAQTARGDSGDTDDSSVMTQVTTPGDRVGDTGDRHTASPDSTGQVTVVTGGDGRGDMTVVTQVTASLEQLRGDLEANHEELALELQTTREEVTGELQDVRAMVEEVAARIERKTSVAGFATSDETPEATESEPGEDDAHQRGEEDRGRERRQDLVWWRALLVSWLMKLKLLADWLMQRMEVREDD